MSRLLVTGSRDWSGRMAQERMKKLVIPVWTILYDMYDEDVFLVHGGARGADIMMARLWKEYWGSGFTERHNADWHKFAKAAGVIRNQEMVDLGADLCLAFLVRGAENRGTKDCISRATKAVIPVIKVWDDGRRDDD